MSAKFLFIPVSSPRGIGEYMRSLTLAQSLRERDSEAEIAFILSEAAPYTKDCPFPAYLCPSSPTHHSAEVKHYIDTFKPTVVIFDAAGRAAQLKHAKHSGAHTVFICQHKKKLAKALGLRRLSHTDALWWVQPTSMLNTLNPWAKIKLATLAKNKLHCIGPIVRTPDAVTITETLKKYRLENKTFVLINAGSGGHSVSGESAADIFARVGRRIIQADPNKKVVIVYGPNYQLPLNVEDGCIHIPSLTPTEFSSLLHAAGIALLSAGSSLFQSLSYGTITVCGAVAKDQQQRIDALQHTDILFPSLVNEDALFAAFKNASTNAHATPIQENENHALRSAVNMLVSFSN